MSLNNDMLCGITPASAGMDMQVSDLCSNTAFLAAKETFKNRIGKWGAASRCADAYFCQLLEVPPNILAISSDGIGSKIELAERCQHYSTLGFDLVAMLADDLICSGAEPTHLSNILDVDCLDPQIISELFLGLKQAADEAGMMVTGGETAELGKRIGGYGSKMHFNWCGTALGVISPPQKPIDGSQITKDDLVIGLKSPGLRSNGFSLARKILHDKFGDEWHKVIFKETKTWGETLLNPSVIYAPHILSLLKQACPLKGLAHITGGGLAANLERILSPWDLGAELDNLLSPSPELIALQELGNIADRQAYEQWNMSHGMLLVISKEDAPKVQMHFEERNILAQIIGRIVQSSDITIHSTAKDKNVLIFPF